MSFKYVQVKTIDEAFNILKEKGSFIYAGGTDLLINIRSGKLKEEVKYLVDIKNIDSLKGIEEDKDFIIIKPLTTIHEVATSEILNNSGVLKILSDAASKEGCFEIRQRATIGGNICNASPGADSATPLLVLNAQVEISKKALKRTILFSDFFLGPNKTVLENDEILTKILVPKLQRDGYCKYFRISRTRGMDLASMPFSIISLNHNDYKLRDTRLAIGAVNPVPCRIKSVENYLKGKPYTDELIAETLKILEGELHPRKESLRASPWYKIEVSKRFLKFALTEIRNYGGGK